MQTQSPDCLTCARFTRCTKSKKGFGYICDKYREFKSVLDLSRFDKDNSFDSAKPFYDQVKERKQATFADMSDNEVENYIDNILSTAGESLPTDFRVDDRDLPQAANFYEFAVSKSFMGQKPFPKQLEIAINLFGEYCSNPKCTDLNYVKNIPTHASYDEILEKVSLLEHGKCPKCHMTKFELGFKFGHPYYNEMIGIAGQRCVTKHTRLLTSNGLQRIGDIAQKQQFKKGFTPFKCDMILENGAVATTDQFLCASIEPTIKLELANGSMLEGTFDHPVLTQRGFVKLKDLNGTDDVVVAVGQNVYGQNGSQLAYYNNLYKVPDVVMQGTKDVQLDFLTNLFSKFMYMEWVDKKPLLVMKSKRITLVEDVMSMLFNMGFLPQLSKTRQRMYTLFLTGRQNMQLFLDLFDKFIYKDSFPSLFHIYKIVSDAVSSITDKIPTCYIPCRDFPVADDDTKLIVENKHCYYVGIAKIRHNMEGKQTYDVSVPLYHRFVGNGIVNHNSGKSILVSLIFAYMIHRYLKLQNPVRVFGLTENTVLEGTVTAVTLAQARSTLFDPTYLNIKESHWFKEYHKMLDFYQNKYGEELYRFKELFFNYKHRKIFVYPATPSKKNMRGRTRFFASVDEISWFYAKQKGAVKLDPDEVYTALANSLLTVRSAARTLYESGYYQIPAPMFCNISSPSSSRDKGMRLLKQSKISKNIYGFHYPSIEMNPDLNKAELHNIELQDPANFKRDFVAIPPDAANPFIINKEAIEKVARSKFVNKVLLNQFRSKSATGVPMITATTKILKKSAIENHPYIMGIDAGYSNNSFGICLLRCYHDDEKQFVVHCDGLAEIIPEPGYTLNFNSLYENVFRPILDTFDVRYIAADRWNSLKILQDIEEEYEIPYRIYMLQYPDFVDLRNNIYAGLVRIPAAEMKLKDAQIMAGHISYPQNFTAHPISHLQMQLMTVEDNMGKSVEKGEKMTDDVFRSLAIAHAMIVDKEIQDTYLMGANEDFKSDISTLAVIGSPGQGFPAGSQGGQSGGIGAMGSQNIGVGYDASLGQNSSVFSIRR